MEWLRQSLLAAFGAAGFALLFRLERKRVPAVFFCGGLAWLVYRVCMYVTRGSIFFSLLFVTALVVCGFECVGKRKHFPGLIYSIPVLIPFIPGADLFRTMMALMQGDIQAFRQCGILLVCQVSAMALGRFIDKLLPYGYNGNYGENPE